MKSVKNFWPLILLLGLTFFLRVIKLENLFYFTYDESIPAFVGRRLILWHHVPLIGGVTPFGVHITPYFYWFLALLLKISNLDPVVWGWVGAALATLTTLMIFKVGNLIGNKKIAFSAATLWTFSFLTNIYDRHFWALYWGPLLSLLTIYSLYKIIKGNQNYVFLLSFALIIGISTDPSNLVLFLLSGLTYFIYKIPLTKKLILATVLILVSLLPLILFDLRHNFANSKPLLNFFQRENSSRNISKEKFFNNVLVFPKAATRIIYVFGNNEVSKQYSYSKEFIKEKYNQVPDTLTVVVSIFLITFLYLAFKEGKKNKIKYLTALLLSSYFLGIQIYGTIFGADIFEHYLTAIFPALILSLATFTAKLPKTIWIFLLSVFVAFNFYKLSKAQNALGLTFKRQAVEYTLEKVGNEPFSLDSQSTRWKYNGYRYLFAVFGNEPVKSYVDPNFAYLYGATPVWENHPQTVVAFVTHDFIPETEDFYLRYAVFKSHEISSQIFGHIEVIIMDNSNGWFGKEPSLQPKTYQQ